MRGLTNESRSFLWRLLHNLLPTEERLHKLHKSPSSLCKLCPDNKVDNVWSHTFSECAVSSPAMEWMLNTVRKYDPSCVKQESVLLQLNPGNKDHILPCVWLITETLQFIWAKRRSKEAINVGEMAAKITAKCIALKTSNLFNEHAANLLMYLEN